MSLRTIVILIPIMVAIAFAWIAHKSRMRQADAFNHYHEAILAGYDASANSLVNAFGADRARELINSLQEESPDVVFDDFNRWVQILRFPHFSGSGRGDGYILYSLGQDRYCHWTLPEGTVLQRVFFDDDEVVFRLYGEITQGSYRYTVPADKPAEYRLKWSSSGPLPVTDLWMLMAGDYCIEQNRLDK